MNADHNSTGHLSTMRTVVPAIIGAIALGAAGLYFLWLARSESSYPALLAVAVVLLALAGAIAHWALSLRHRIRLAEEVEMRAKFERLAADRIALLGMVSHELRTPLQTMLGTVELLAMQHEQGQHSPIVDRLFKCVELISGQLDNISQYAKLSTGRSELRSEAFDVVESLRRIADENAAAARANQQTLSLNLSDRPTLTLVSDPIRFHQIISNYVTNAIKYAGPVAINIDLSVRSHKFGSLVVADALEVVVQDAGPGIKPEDTSHIWEPFIRGASAARGRKGSGLGLAVVKLLAHTAGWEVGVRSNAGSGASFYLVLPLATPRPDAS